MSLDFDLGGVKDWDTPKFTHPADREKPREQQRWHPVTDALVWKMMAIDMGTITAKNVDEVWFRVRLLQLLDGADLKSQTRDIFISRQDLVDHIGLSTNVSTKSRTEWLRRQLGPKGNGYIREFQQSETAMEIVDQLSREKEKVET